MKFLTEIDTRKQIVRTKFHGETNTFCFDPERFPLVEAMKVAAEVTAGLVEQSIAKRRKVHGTP